MLTNTFIRRSLCRFSVVFLCLAVTQIILVHPGLGQEWQKYPGNPLFSAVGDPGSWNGTQTPYVVGHGLQDDTHYKLYISGFDGEHHSIGLVTSTDLESGWTFQANNPLLTVGDPGSWDDDQVFGAMVLKDGDIYKMWYSGEGSGMTDGAVGIGYATSPDGIEWTKDTDHNPVLEPGPDTWDGMEVYSPYVIKEVDGTYKMWYSGCDGSVEQIGYATSPDGINWTKYAHNPVLDTGPESAVLVPTVLMRGGDYGMWYSGDGAIHFASSENGIQWSKMLDYWDLSCGEMREWDSDLITSLEVFKEDTTFKMLYFGSDLTTHFGVGLATLEGLGRLPAEIEVFPEYLQEDVSAGETVMREVTIYNQGEADLTFDFLTYRSAGPGA